MILVETHSLKNTPTKNWTVKLYTESEAKHHFCDDKRLETPKLHNSLYTYWFPFHLDEGVFYVKVDFFPM